MNPPLIIWIVACMMFTLIEALTQQMVSIWFLTGSIAALILSIFDISFKIQCIAFVIVSFVTLLLFRPLLRKFVSFEAVATNTDSNIGEMAIVTQTFDEETLEGRILVNNMDWAAKSEDGVIHQKGDRVIIVKIQGVKCLVKKI